MGYIVRDDHLEESGNWLVYAWDACKKFGAEVYHTWRSELFTSLVIAGVVYVITVVDDRQAWKNFMVTVYASAFVLGGFLLWHVIRTPLLIHRETIRQRRVSDNWGFGALGVVALIGLAFGLCYVTRLAVHFAVPDVTMKIPSPDIVAKDAQIAELKKQLGTDKQATSMPPRWNEGAGPQSGPIGPVMAVEIVDEFSKLPKPCLFKITSAPDKPNLHDTLEWIIMNGAKCERYEDRGPINVDQGPAPKLTNDSGFVIHWNESFKAAEHVANLFNSAAYRVRISHQMPAQSPPTLIWIDIGPGSPSKLK